MIAPAWKLRLFALAILIASFALVPTANACGWEQTCNTVEWLQGELAPYLP